MSPRFSRSIALNASHKLILAAAAVLFAVGTTLAIVQPGDLGDDDVTASATTSTTLAVTTTTSAPESTTTVDPGETTTTVAGATTTSVDGSSSTTMAGGSTTTVAGATSTTVASGLGGVGSGNVNPDGTVADTGAESMLAPGLALLGLGLAARRVLRPRSN